MLDISRLQAGSEALTIGLAAVAAAWVARRLGDGDLKWSAWAAAACFASVTGVWIAAWFDVLPTTVRWLGAPRLALLGFGWLFTLELASRLAAARGVRLAYAIAAVAAAMVLWRFGLGALYAHASGPRMGEFRPWLWADARALAQGGPAVLLLWLALRRGSSTARRSPTEAATRAAWAAAAWFAVAAAAQVQQLFPSLRFPYASHAAIVACSLGAIAAVRAYRLRAGSVSRGSTDDARTRDGAS
jgi:hypothetical protein